MSAKRILVIESNRPVEGLSGALFRRRECVLDVASSGAEGLTTAETRTPDLVVYDALVSDYGASDFVQALHSATKAKDLPVIVLVPEDRASEESAILEAGAAAVLVRPASLVDLNSKLCDLLGISLRRHVRTFVKMKVDATVGAATHFATIGNISLGGVMIQTEHPIRTGEIIKLSFFLPGDDDPITAIAKVVRGEGSGEKGYGCQFIDLSDVSRERIHEFVTSAEGDD